MFSDYRLLSEKRIVLDEGKAVTFDGKVYPEGNWAIILGGGPGSGKTYSLQHVIPIDAKVFDADHINDIYIQMVNLKPEKAEQDPLKGKYNLKNPEHTTILFNHTKEKDYLNKEQDAFLKQAKEDLERKGVLPNVIFDTTGTNGEIAHKVAAKLHNLGYKVAYIWIATSRRVAIDRNKNRSRVVDQEYFHHVHNAAMENIPKFLRDDAARSFDSAWIVFGSGTKDKEMLNGLERADLEKNPAIQLDKYGDGFRIPARVAHRLKRILGPKEEHPENPEHYKHF